MAPKKRRPGRPADSPAVFPSVHCCAESLIVARVWREIADPRKHRDFMSVSNPGGVPVAKRRDNLVVQWVYLAEIDGTLLQFSGLDQVRECRAYFERKTHPSTRYRAAPVEHCWHHWYCRLPAGIKSLRKRKRVLKALDEILRRWSRE